MSDNINNESMKPKQLFDENASRGTQTLILGETTNIREWNRIKYPWSVKMRNHMLENFWRETEVDTTPDKREYAALPEHYRRAIRKSIARLNFLDSEQCENLPNVRNFITAAEISSLINIQTFQEEIHALTYSVILDSVFEPQEIEDTYDEWRNDPYLKSLNKSVADVYQYCNDNMTPENFVLICVANLILEGLYFWSGFSLFHSLKRDKRMVNTAKMILFIQKDEHMHVVLFQNMINILRKEFPELFTPELIQKIYNMFKAAVEHEVRWGMYLSNNQIEGMSNEMINGYIKFLANQRLMGVGLEALYPEFEKKHPMEWVDEYFDLNSIKQDFFEGQNAGYTMASRLDWIRWDEDAPTDVVDEYDDELPLVMSFDKVSTVTLKNPVGAPAVSKLKIAQITVNGDSGAA